jgi:hypothetical protein
MPRKSKWTMQQMQELLEQTSSKQLAAILTELAFQEPKVMETVNRILKSPKENLKNFEKKLTALQNGTSGLFKKNLDTFIRDLNGMLKDLLAAKPDPETGMQLASQFILTADRAFLFQSDCWNDDEDFVYYDELPEDEVFQFYISVIITLFDFAKVSPNQELAFEKILALQQSSVTEDNTEHLLCDLFTYADSSLSKRELLHLYSFCQYKLSKANSQAEKEQLFLNIKSLVYQIGDPDLFLEFMEIEILQNRKFMPEV